jgi:xanthine/CO dehydrogenase XdhC/CoxF family maturation factor
MLKDGVTEDQWSAVRAPAGLDLGCTAIEEIAISILCELLAWERQRPGLPLRQVRETHLPSGARPATAGPQAPPPPLTIVGHGRIAEELARLAALVHWPATVNAAQADPQDFPASTCLVTGDVDFARLGITPQSHVVIATLHKGDHLSMAKALEGGAAYVGLVASPKRSKLVLEHVRERGLANGHLEGVHAPAGLDLGAVNPTEIAFSIMAEMIAVHRGGTCLSITEANRAPTGANCEVISR